MLKKMKLSTPVLLAALSVVAGLLLLVFVGCSAQTPTPETPEAEEGGGRAAGTVSATGEVVPAQKATLSFTTSGTLVTLNVDVGDRVQQGDVIGQLDTAVVDAEIARAEATVRVAEANLAQIKADPRTPSIEQLKSNMAAASASLAEAIANRDKVRAGASDYEIARAKADTQAAFMHAMDERFLRDYLLDLLDEPENWDECDPTPKKPCPPNDNSAEWMDEKFENAQE